MKLFQRLLVAPAALGLMAPVAANADTAFASTTKLSGSAVFTLGSVNIDGIDDNEELHMQYAYSLDVNSSFTGEDNLYAGIEAGDSNGPLILLDSAVDVGEELHVHSLFYSFPVGDLTVTAGPLVDQDDVIAATTSAYSADFVLGGLAGSMPFSTAGAETGPGVAVSYDNGNGVVASISYVADDGEDSDLGIAGEDAEDVTTFSLGYNGDGFGGGVILSTNDNAGDDNINTFGGGIYYSPESFPATISVSYDTLNIDDFDMQDFFVGVDYEVGPGELSVGYASQDIDEDDDLSGFEVSYTYNVNDSISITPGFFTFESGDDEIAGVVVETVFNF